MSEQDTPTNLARLASVASEVARGNKVQSCIWWIVSVAGSAPEIARFSGGKMFTVGCAEPHELEAVELLAPLSHESKWPRTKKAQAQHDKLAARFAASNPEAGYRTFPSEEDPSHDQ